MILKFNELKPPKRLFSKLHFLQAQRMHFMSDIEFSYRFNMKFCVPIGKKLHEPATEGTINRLHYRVTVLIFLGCSLIVTCLEWVGNGSKISCVMEGPVDSWTIPQNVINTYCYVLTTFTIPKHWNTKIGHDSAQIGVGHYNPKNDDVTYKAYYQWVPFVLFLQVSKMEKKLGIFKSTIKSNLIRVH